MTNWDIAQELKEIKKLLEFKGNQDLASLFEQSAYTVSVLEFPLQESREVKFLPIKIIEEIEQLLATGYSPMKENLKKEIPKGLRTIGELPGLRTENVKKLYEILNIETINDLKKLVYSGKIRTRKEFGARFEEQLRRSILNYENEKNELSLFEALSYANSIKMVLKEDFKIELAGSVRRGKETVRNIDFVVAGNLDEIKNRIINLLSFNYVATESNLHIFRDMYENKIKFYVVPEEYFFSALQYYTGSRSHNKEISEIAKTKGFRISKEGFILNKCKTEEDLYKSLNLQYVPPEIREGGMEIRLAKSNSIPSLISIGDIKGDLHIHSNFSDGTNSIEEIKDETYMMNYEYIAITDHSHSLWLARGLSSTRLLKEIEIIDKINKEETNPRILKGIESEINEKGKLDLNKEEIGKLEIVLGALHSYSQDKFENTIRIKSAINEGINVLAHPTGRIVNVREPIAVDLEEIFEECIKKNVALEINLFPSRLDLSSELIRQAKKAGVKTFSVGTDAHNIGHLHFMKFGIKLLKRAWVEASEVINTHEEKEIREILWTTKH